MEDYIDFFNRYILGNAPIVIGFYFFTKFLNKKVKIYYYLLFAVIGFAVMQMAYEGSIVQYLIYTLLLMAAGILLCRAGWKSVILYAALTVEIMELSLGMANSLSGMLYPLTSSWNRNVIAVLSVLLGSAALTLAAVCYHAAYRYFSYYETLEKQYLFTILIPILMIFFMDEYIGSIIYGNITVKNAGGIVIDTNYNQMFIIQLFGMASLFCLMFAYKKLLQNFHLSMELSLLVQEEESLSRYVEEARARYEKTKAFRHDIKNHITVVKDLLQSGKSEQALTYIGDLADMTETLSFPCSTNNPVVDILVGNKLGIAKSMGIDARCSLFLPHPCLIRDIDLGIILSNALDNAIQACKNANDVAEKQICVSGRIQGDFVLLEVENSFQGNGRMEKGTGLSNIKAVTEKYQGAMNIKTQGMSFLLSVLLVIPRHTESIPRQIR